MLIRLLVAALIFLPLSSSLSLLRPLGSQELLFAPRDYPGKELKETVHCCFLQLSSLPQLSSSITHAQTHNPLLTCTLTSLHTSVRNDPLKMVRSNQPSPSMFFEQTNLTPKTTKFTHDLQPSDFSLALDTPLSGPLLWEIQEYTDGLLFKFNHCISDQSSFMNHVAPFFCDQENPIGGGLGMCLEDNVLEGRSGRDDLDGAIENIESGFNFNTAQYVFKKITETIGKDISMNAEIEGIRTSKVSFVSLSTEDTKKFISSKGSSSLTSHILSLIHKTYSSSSPYHTKTVLSLGYDKLLNYEVTSLGCNAGSMDIILPSGEYDVSKEIDEQINYYRDNNLIKEIIRVWDTGTKAADVTNLVNITSQSNNGRSYSISLSNAGSYNLKGVKKCYYATGQSQVGAVKCYSVITVNGVINFISHGLEEERGVFECIEGVGVREGKEVKCYVGRPANTAFNVVPKLTGLYAAFTAITYSPTFYAFYKNIEQIKSNSSPQDANDAINFWIFFAVAHPILQPILWISEVMHGSPGPRVAGLIPLSFILFNVGFIMLTGEFKSLVLGLNVFLVSSFLGYVGGGLKGVGGMSDYNLGLNDDFRGERVRGCPSYEDVRQPSMNNFDLKKYEGLWYEHKFHDWTQFKEVYDTTLDIQLTEGGWKDDFGIRGPSPISSPKSWDKSPVANGAHYFLFGRVDKSDPTGVLREKGFGVEFPNYIVDVQKDSEGNYKEAIQFQCLERGGVRVFEGINFMSRNEVMEEAELNAMHARAATAGMEKYGSAPEQMHTVERRLKSQGSVDDGAWQAMWKGLGVDKLLEKLAVLIEDGGR